MSIADRTETMTFNAKTPEPIDLLVRIRGDEVRFGGIPGNYTNDEVLEILAKATDYVQRVIAAQKQAQVAQEKANAEAEASTALPVASESPPDAPEAAPAPDAPAEDTAATDETAATPGTVTEAEQG